MPEATFTLAKVFTKDGEHDGRKWVRYDLKPADDDDARYSTFSDSIGSKAQEWEGAKVTVAYEETERGNKITDLRQESAPADKPQFSKQARPEEQRNIHASVALQQAVATLTHTIKVDTETEEIRKRVLPLARAYYHTLRELVGDDEGVPF